MAAEGDTGGFFALSHQVGGGGVEVIDPVLNCVIYHLVHGILVYLGPSLCVAGHGPAHAAEADQGHFVAVLGIFPVNHLLRAFVHGAGGGGLLAGGAAYGKGRGARSCYLDEISSFHGSVD